MPNSPSYTCFNGHNRMVSGTLQTVAMAVKQVAENEDQHQLLIFDDQSGRSIDINTQGSYDEVLARFATHPSTEAEPEPSQSLPRGRGRPKLGVVPKEITLLPRHWDWLAQQPGGASVTLRKLVDQARREHNGQDLLRQAQERAYHFMVAMAGDLPQFEAASRALFAQQPAQLSDAMQSWPNDIRHHVLHLATPLDA
ncbi:MAG: DUF2239 family protein [Neisseriaceae bacterium]